MLSICLCTLVISLSLALPFLFHQTRIHGRGSFRLFLAPLRMQHIHLFCSFYSFFDFLFLIWTGLVYTVALRFGFVHFSYYLLLCCIATVDIQAK